MVVARQRPETAKGIVFMLLEDERGDVNLIVPPPVYERHRALVRAAPLLRAPGRLERREGTTNVIVTASSALERTRPAPGSASPLTPVAAAATRRRDAAPPASTPSPSSAPSPPPATASAGGDECRRGSPAGMRLGPDEPPSTGSSDHARARATAADTGIEEGCEVNQWSDMLPVRMPTAKVPQRYLESQ